MLLNIGVISLFPEMFDALGYGVIGQALKNKKIKLTCWNPRDYTDSKHGQVDDKPYGGGPGMVMQAEPLARAIEAAKAALPKAQVIYLSPQGQVLSHPLAMKASYLDEVIFIAGRYEGIDERVISRYVDAEWSIGDYVLTGGELPTMVVIDAMVRLIPGVLGDEMSSQQDSFVAGLLDYPHYTRPEMALGQTVPEVLLSGDHQAIANWREAQARARTQVRRPDLLEE